MADTALPVELDIGTVQPQPGWTELMRPASPAAGAIFSRKIPPDTWERLRSLQVTLTTSAVVANRFPRLILRDQDNNQFLAALLSPAVTASSVVTLNAVPGGITNLSGSGSSFTPLPDLILRSGYSMNIEVPGIDVGDQLSGIALLLRRIPAEYAETELRLS
jgi:hypothetical protein